MLSLLVNKQAFQWLHPPPPLSSLSERGPSPLLNPRLGITVNSLGSPHRRKGEGKPGGLDFLQEVGRTLPIAPGPGAPLWDRTRAQSVGPFAFCMPSPAAWPTRLNSGERQRIPHLALAPRDDAVLGVSGTKCLKGGLFGLPFLVPPCVAMATKTTVSTTKARMIRGRCPRTRMNPSRRAKGRCSGARRASHPRPSLRVRDRRGAPSLPASERTRAPLDLCPAGGSQAVAFASVADGVERAAQRTS